MRSQAKKFFWLFVIAVPALLLFQLLKDRVVPSALLPVPEADAPTLRSAESSASSPDRTAKEETAQATSTLADFLKRRDPKANWSISRHADGRPAHILGGQIPLQGIRGEDVLIETAKILGISPQQLQRSEKESPPYEYWMDQVEGQHRVYGAGIKGFADKENAKIYHIATELREIRETDLRQNKTAEDAVAIVRKRFALTEKAKIKVSSRPYVYGTTPDDNQLAWRIQYSIVSGGVQSHEVLVSASTGQILVDHPLEARSR